MTRAASTPARRVALAVAALVSSACTYPRTQIVLRVDTDMAQGPGGLTALDVTVLSQEGAERARHVIPLGVPTDAGLVRLPADLLGISPRGNEAGRAVTVRVVARSGATELFATRAVSTFVAGRTTVLEVFLADLCRGAPPCAAGQTCGRDGACVPERRGVLPDYDGGPLARDAAAPAPADAASDAPPPPPRDAPAPACGAAAQPCCVGAMCNAGLVCESGSCQPACGADGQRCCMGTACNAGLSCQGTACRPPPCGGDGQACCGGACSPGLNCVGGLCRSPFCGDAICNNGETCLSCFGDCPRDPQCHCYVRCCDNSLRGPHPTPNPDLCIAWSTTQCTRLRVEWGAMRVFTRDAACP